MCPTWRQVLGVYHAYRRISSNDPTIDDCAYTKNNRYDKQSRAVKVQKTILRPSLQNVTLRLNSICEVPNPKKFDQDDAQKKEKALWRWRKNNIKIY